MVVFAYATLDVSGDGGDEDVLAPMALAADGAEMLLQAAGGGQHTLAVGKVA